MTYNYIITHVKDAKAFIQELEDMAPSYVISDEETGKKSWTIQHTPIVKNENGSLAMSILTNEELAFIDAMTTIESLGTYEELFADDAKHAIYKSIYLYDVPLGYVDEDGNTVEYFRPQKIGEFAR
ncbi:hypothetical protein [Sulfuricurvum sp.]|uniref:hypothetical protein n=1 Tax=Sulfuricurvum sp. TaxID=2025608 RepID=UPI002E2EAA15|nr:hypothetical protein [Sulfuricurvum sp.]HEX5331002.1 hypothetical protein [Sulfuricurvum sp.]